MGRIVGARSRERDGEVRKVIRERDLDNVTRSVCLRKGVRDRVADRDRVNVRCKDGALFVAVFVGSFLVASRLLLVVGFLAVAVFCDGDVDGPHVRLRVWEWEGVDEILRVSDRVGVDEIFRVGEIVGVEVFLRTNETVRVEVRVADFVGTNEPVRVLVADEVRVGVAERVGVVD